MSSVRAKKVLLAELRQQIAALGPTLCRDQAPLLSGWSALDAAIEGWPVPGISEISGPPGSGRIQLSLPSLVQMSQHHRVAVVDPLQQLYPPGWKGIRLENLLIVRPALEKSTWAAEQLARSGCFGIVGLLDPPRLGRAAARLARASEHGACSLHLWTTEGDTRIPAKLRIQLLGRQGHHLHVRLPHTTTELWL